MTTTNFPYPLFLTKPWGAWHSALRRWRASSCRCAPSPPTALQICSNSGGDGRLAAAWRQQRRKRGGSGGVSVVAVAVAATRRRRPRQHGDGTGGAATAVAARQRRRQQGSGVLRKWYLPTNPTSPHCDSFPANPRSYPCLKRLKITIESLLG